jgi:predicted chitinase
MTLLLTPQNWRQIWPNAPQEVISAFVAKPEVLAAAGITATRNRLLYFTSNIEHECGGFTIRNLTENTNYTAERMAAVWPGRFRSAAAVRAKFGTAPGWQLKAFDEIYGDRMGNRPGTHDGSLFIGRAGPQVTGRDGYASVGKVAGLDLLTDPTRASKFDLQPEVCAAFWSWKNLNHFADAGDFLGCVKIWNGGTNGLADRRTLMAGNDPVIARLSIARDTASAVNSITAPSIVPADSPIVTDTEWMQRSLNTLGAKPSLDEDGSYGSSTKKAVKDFQAHHAGLTVDGIAGQKTIAAIQSALDAKKRPA